MRLRLALAVLVYSVSTAQLIAAPPAAAVNAGKWQITLQTVGPLQSAPMVSEVCIPPEAIAKIGPPVSRAADACQVVPGQFANGVLAFTMKCPQIHRTVSTKFTFNGDTYSGEITIDTDGTIIKQTIEAHRLGACDAQ